jgi:hypothetical protein
MPVRGVRLGRLVAGVLGVLVGIAYTVHSFAFPFGAASAPGPGVFPRIVGFAAIAISVLVVLESLLSGGPDGEVEFPRGAQLRSAAVFAAATVGLVLALPWVGQYVASAVYMVVMLRALSGLGWTRVIGYGVAIALGLSAFFIEVLRIQLPDGVFW